MAYSNFYAGFYEHLRRISRTFKWVWAYHPNRYYLLVSLFFQILSFWQAFSIRRNLSGELLVLRYKIDFGANLVGEPHQIFLYPIFSVSVLVLNLFLVMLLSSKSKARVFNQLLLAAATIFEFFMVLYLMSIYLINFR